MSRAANISLPPRLKRWADSQAAKKGFGSADELVADMLRREQDAESGDSLEAILLERIDAGKSIPMTATREKLEAYLTEAIKGPFTPMTDKDWEEIRAEGRKRARERRKK